SLTVLQSRYTTAHISSRKMIGIHVSTRSDMKLASMGSSIGMHQPSLERLDGLVNRREAHACIAPGGGARGRACVVEPARRLLDEDDWKAAREEAANRRVVAHVGGNAEEDDLLRLEALEQAVGVRVREHVEALLQQQELAAAQPPLRHVGQRERHRVELLRLDDLPGAA